MSADKDELDVIDRAADEVVRLGNQLSDKGDDNAMWDVASGILAGAIQFWLYSRQPCGDPHCESCEQVSTAALRLAELLRETREFAQESEYYHSPTDSDVGRA